MNIKKSLATLALMLPSSAAFAVPKTVTESVPLEAAVMRKAAETEQGRKTLAFVMSLTTFQDHEDPTKFYYSPTLRVSPNPAGAATIVANNAAIDRRSKIANISDNISETKTWEYDSIRIAYNALTLKTADTKLTAQERNALDVARLALKAELDALVARANASESLIPQSILNAKLERMADLMGLSGFPISQAEVRDVGSRTRKFAQLSNSNGGFFSGNLFAGFTPEQIELLRFYKQMRTDVGLRQVTLVKLPVQNIEYFSLAETFQNSQDKATIGTPLFRSFAGSGDISSGTFNFDLTLDGAERFSSAPPPVVVPVGIKANLMVRPPAFTARLSCDFTTGWSVKGRTDVKDGLVIYNNDIYTSMVAKSVSETNKPCRVHVSGGDGSQEQFAYTQAIIALQDRFTNLYFNRVNLAKSEKMAYWNKVQEDIAANRHRGSNDGWSGLFGAARSLGWVGTILGAAANASQFYWHTNVQNIEHLDQVKFEQELVIDTNKTISVDLGTADLCLAWNPKLSRYLACTETEAQQGQSVSEAFQEARTSLVCSPENTTAECANRRNTQMPTGPSGNLPSERPVPPPSSSIPDEI
jgi:hypothetical protein